MISRLSMLATAGAASVAAFAAAAQAQPNMTQTCSFQAGPRQGQVIDFSGTPGSRAVPVGNRCADMRGSSGVAVPQGISRWPGPGWQERGQGRFYASPGAPRGVSAWDSRGNLSPGFSQTCSFNNGPRGGSTFDYSHTLGAEPLVVGAPCVDGRSRGVAVPQGAQ